MITEKRTFGQYYTTTNPFVGIAFKKWLDVIPNLQSQIILEPFAGSNNIPKMILEGEVLLNEWKCFDIAPSEDNKCLEFKITKQDTIKNFPIGFNVCITNPPYLGKNSASRRGLEYPETQHDDLYKHCLEIMLNNVPYVAAIIPETFITAELFQGRLHSVVSLTCKMFEDTECPVCLAMFVPEITDNFELYRMDEYLGTHQEMLVKCQKAKITNNWKFNDKLGEIGIVCIDNQQTSSIHFCEGKEIDSSCIKVSSRAKTRVSGLPNDIKLNVFLDICNELLNDYRVATKDIFLTSFKGLRKDGYYRRRLDFGAAKNIMNLALEKYLERDEKLNEKKD